MIFNKNIHIDRKITYFLIIFITFFYTSININASENVDSEFLKENPSLNKFIYETPHSNIYIGVGITPLAMTDNRFVFSGSIFQLHYINNIWDIEIFNASLGLNIAENSMYSSYHFIFRTAPKIKVNKNLSVGVILGWELVSFPNVNKKEYKDGYFTPMEPFSSSGGILGAIISQEFRYYDHYLIKISGFLHYEFYSVEETRYSWKYWFEEKEIELDPDKSAIAPGFIGGLELSILF